LQLHRDLYKFSGKEMGGAIKSPRIGLKRQMLRAIRGSGLLQFLLGKRLKQLKGHAKLLMKPSAIVNMILC